MEASINLDLLKRKMSEDEYDFFDSEDHVDEEYYEEIVKQYPYQHEG